MNKLIRSKFLHNVKYVTIHQFLILLVLGTAVFTGSSGSESGLVIYSLVGSPDKHLHCPIHQSAGTCWTFSQSLNYHSGICFRKFFLVEQGKSITLVVLIVCDKRDFSDFFY